MRYNNKHRSFSYLVFLCFFLVAKTGHTAIHKSPNDPRQYLSFTLSNQMKVLVISDPDTDKAAAALNVAVGSMANPPHRQGLAHFLEHMLFLGTEKYPDAGSYQAFISQNGGNHNAYTANENTNYYFDIKADQLEPALDRFSRFFIDPLFNEKYVDRERHAVNSEYQSKLRDDGRRGYSAGKQAMNPAHSISRFAVGSLETLSNQAGQLREDLLSFYNRYYSANLMTLVIVGKQPVDELKQLASAKFSAVANHNVEAFKDNQPLYTDLPKQLNIRTLKDFQQLTLTFPLPSVKPYIDEKPLYFIASQLGYEGKGSLFSLLKARGWANGLNAYKSVNLDNQSALQITISLTDTGLQHYEEVVTSVFAAIRLLEKNGISAELYQEAQQLSNLRFRFKEKTQPINYASALAVNLSHYPDTEIISADYLLKRFDPELIRQLLSRITPDNMLLTLQAQDLQTDQQDPWFNTPYGVYRFGGQQLAQWHQPEPIEALTIRNNNPFIANKLTAKAVTEVEEVPQLILQQDGYSLWHKQDTRFRIPRADFFISVLSEKANASPRHAVMTSLYTRLIEDQMNETLYDASLAGLNTRIYSHMRGFSVRISGYDEKQPELLQAVMANLNQARFSEPGFQRLKELYIQELENKRKDKPYNQTISEVYSLLLQNWNAEKKLDALRQLTLEDIESFIPELLAETEIRMLSHGNRTAAEAAAMAATVKHSMPTQAARYQNELPVILLDKAQALTQTLPLEHNDSAISVYFQGKNSSLKARAEFALLSEIMSAPFYSRLRTEQQLGYIVFETNLPLRNAPGLAFVVQSPNTDPRGLEQHIDSFMEQMESQLRNMTGKQLSHYKASVLSRINRQPTRISELSERYWQEIDRNDYRFDSRSQLSKAVKSLSLHDIRKSFTMLPERRLTVRAFGQKHREHASENELSQVCETDIAQLKQQGQFVPEA